MRRRIFPAAGAILLLLVPPLPAPAAEEILSYDSSITVGADGSIAVAEDIRVRAEGEAILHGIYRDFPTDYRDGMGRLVRVPFEVVSVERDGRPEPFHTKAARGGVRVYAGDAGVLVEPGEHLYRLSYRTGRQLGFFPDHDELYWNVTGNGWEFPIRSVTARVTLPAGIPRDGLKVEGYTGPVGSKERSLAAGVDEEGRPAFSATRELGPSEGMTIVVSFPKGFVAEPTPAQRAGWLLRDNLGLGLGVLGLLSVLGFYLWQWSKVGRDPEAGVPVPRWEPPGGLPPEAVRFLDRMGYDDRAFSAALIDMAVKGYLDIEKKGGGYLLRRLPEGKEDLLSTTQRRAAGFLFPAPGSEIELSRGNWAAIGGARKVISESLKAEFEAKAFNLNRGVMRGGVAASLAAAVLGILLSPGVDAAPAIFVLAWVLAWSFFTGMLLSQRQWIPALVCLAALAGGAWIGVMAMSLPLALLVLALAGVNGAFLHLMRAPTRAGRKMLDGIAGLRMYLETAEKDRLNLMNPPEETPQLFERLLPYALALGVEQRWSERFAGVLAQATSPGGGPYSPSWYHGGDLRGFSPAAFASDIGSSLSSAIGSSSSPPGSSSGSGGGGSSGGGGGGGGGGGW